jgi:pyochelin biosynthesis protein PchC
MDSAVTWSVQPWFRRFRPIETPPSMRLVGLPHAGGAASLFRTWGRNLPAGVDLLAACYPGRQERIGEPCLTSLDELADAVAEALRPLLDVPVALFGHSMGASVAHEVAVRLAGRGQPPVALFVSGRLPPHRLRPRNVSRAGDDALVADVVRLGGTSAEVLADPDIRAMVLPALRGDYRIVDGYRPGQHPVLDLPITAYLGLDDPETNLTEMREWALLTTGRCETIPYRGGHFFLTEHETDLVTDVHRRLSGS